MMNIRNLGSKESVAINYKDGICAKLCVKLWFESRWCFCNITELGSFSKQLFKNKVPNNHFEKSVQMQPYAYVFKIGVLLRFRNDYVSLFLITL